MEDEDLLLRFTLCGMVVEPGTGRVFMKLELIQVPLLGLRVLRKTMLMGIFPMLIELGAAVLLEGLVSSMGGEGPSLSGNRAVMLVELREVTISVVAVKTDNGTVGIEVTSAFGPTLIHGVVGEADTIVTDMDSGHGVVEDRVSMVVVWVGEVIREVMVEEVFVVSADEMVGKAVTEEGPVFSALDILEEVEEKLLLVETSELGLMEDDIIAGIEEEMMVPKGVLIALVEVLNIGKAEERETPEVLRAVMEVGGVTKFEVPVLTTSVVEGVLRDAVIKVAGGDVYVGVGTSVLVVVNVPVGGEGVDVAWVAGTVGRVNTGVVSVVSVGAGFVAGKDGNDTGKLDAVKVLLVTGDV